MITRSTSLRRAAVVVFALTMTVVGGQDTAAVAQQVADCPSRGAPLPYDGVAPLPVVDPPVGGERLAGCGLVVAPDTPAPPSGISAQAWVVADIDSGEVLAARDPHGRHRPASAIKLLTALVAIQRLPLDQVITASAADDAQIGSSAGVRAGQDYTVAELLAGLILQSGNDTAWALAGAVGGPAAMTAAMDERARELGAYDTRATTPSGLDGAGASVSAYDLALIGRAAADDPVLSRLLTIRAIRFPGAPQDVLRTDNRLLLTYPGALGGKVGYTDLARHSYVGLAERDGRRLVAVLVRAEQRPLATTEQTAALLDYGFALPEGTSVGSLVERSAAPAPPMPEPALDAELPFVIAPPAADATTPLAAPDTDRTTPILIGALLAVVVPTLLSGLFAVRARRRRAADPARP